MDSNPNTHNHATVSPAKSSLPDSTDSRELYISIAIPIPDNGPHQEQQQHQGYVDVLPNHTLADVRTLIFECFDEDMLPPDHDFYFCAYGIRVSKKQEARKLVWPLAAAAALRHVKAITNSTVVSIHSRLPREQLQKRPRTEHENKNDEAKANKKARTTAVTTTQKELVNEDEPLEARKLYPDTPKQTNDYISTPESVWLSQKLVASPEKGDAGFIASDDGKEEEDETVEQVHSNGGDEDVVYEYGEPATHIGDVSDIDATDDPKETPSKKPARIYVHAPNDTNDQALSDMESDERGHTDLEDNDGDLTVVIEEQDTHRVHKEALEQSTRVLREIETLLKENLVFCSEERRLEWVAEIQENLQMTAPDNIIGVLGNTGVGKSSLLNALLDEDSVLPTSGSRGCTATVVELRFNKALQTNMSLSTTVPVYKGEVEFITLLEWRTELKLLIEECCNNDEKTVYFVEPQAERQPDAAAAWSKIDQVYGSGTMLGCKGQSMQHVLDRLSNELRVVHLLTPDQGRGKPYKVMDVAEGEVTLDKAAVLLKGFVEIDPSLCRNKRKWAQAFRSKINDYVSRKGNGDQPQTWPLIRRVLLEGPWPVLSSGACLVRKKDLDPEPFEFIEWILRFSLSLLSPCCFQVDLPGVRDANVARAKVSEKYLQNCSEIWVVAPIKRAVDDGTAKELLGEQFKRRLLMDGQYGNVKVSPSC
jgi:nitrate reductase NapAB chaperone NapD